MRSTAGRGRSGRLKRRPHRLGSPPSRGIIVAFLNGAVNQRRAQRVAQELHRLYEDLKDHKERVREAYAAIEEFDSQNCSSKPWRGLAK